VWAGIVAFEIPGIDSRELAAKLAGDFAISVRAIRHASGFAAVRASTHIYNTHDEIDRLASALKRIT
jgi:selenocysteine lyase/cysteine desulfurase